MALRSQTRFGAPALACGYLVLAMMVPRSSGSYGDRCVLSVGLITIASVIYRAVNRHLVALI